ncbi:hypothetical protein LTR37_001038 [Vermiconidia calcicola]|uniref:Uncharacterized protein n=1 Tax=Vermiconidia calcicola TaxID=1690605 RepID=A0ACC3NX02_9PEZI|nr:hypothetical protein LTR37_001038 [Vermiconidia calcicola]
MLLYAFHRIWAQIVISIAFIFATWSARHAINSTFLYALFAIISLYIAQTVTSAINAERRIGQLGSHAYRIRDYYPFGLGTLAQALYYFSHWRNHEFWWNNFNKNRKPNNQYTVEAITLGQRLVFTSDEENIKAVLATQFQDFGKGPQFRKEWKDFLGLSIFTTDGEIWHNSRMLLRPQFIKDRVSDLHTFESHVQVLLPMLAGAQNGAMVRVDDLFYRFTLDAATDFLMGKSVDSLRNPQAEFADAFTEVQRVQAIIARAGPINAMVPRKNFYKALDILNRFVGQYIDQALQLPQEELEKTTKSDEGYTFLHAIASYTRDRDVLRDQLVAILLAGRDTTAVTLSWLFYELSKHSEIVQKLQEEIMSFVGPNREPTYTDLKSMRYLQHTLNEVLRLYPVVPYNVRVALKDTTLPRGGGPDGTEPIGVAKDTPIGYSTFILQRREDIYPAASEKFAHYLDFSPDRWDQWTPKSWTYIPFNGGPRICIGQQFALTEMAYTVVRILQTFERIECKQEEPPQFRSDIVLQPAMGVHIGFSKRQ